MKSIKNLIKTEKYREIAAYIVFGVLTTLVNWVVYTVLSLCTPLGVTALNAIAWTAAVIFAFFTNKVYVFKSGAGIKNGLFVEFATFVAARAISGAIEIFMPACLISIGLDQRFFGIEGSAAKLLVSVIVIAFNYIVSKFLVFSPKSKRKLSRGAVLLIAAFAVITVFIFTCNILTDLCADDYGYFINFATKERIRTVWEIFPSMAAHAHKMNGRLVAHFLVQLFLLLPLWIFKILNTAAFMVQLVLIYKISGAGKKYGAAVFLAAFGMLWIFQPAFGQVNLWLDGSFNYLWSLMFGLAFLLPYIRVFNNQKEIENKAAKILFVLLGFLAGAYLENASAAVIFAAAVLIILIKIYKKKRLPICYYLSAAASVCGYLFMMSAPAEHTNKSAEFAFKTLLDNFVFALKIFKGFAALFVIFALLLVLALLSRKNIDKIILSLTFFVSAMCSNFIMIFASYYPERCAFAPVVFLTASNALLLSVVLESAYKVWPLCISAVLAAFTVYYAAIGLTDIYRTHKAITANNEYIIECREQGILDIELPMVKAKTKYSVVNGLKYLDTGEREIWPNNSISKYYGINSVIGVE